MYGISALVGVPLSPRRPVPSDGVGFAARVWFPSEDGFVPSEDGFVPREDGFVPREDGFILVGRACSFG